MGGIVAPSIRELTIAPKRAVRFFYAARIAERCGVVALLQRAGVEERHLVSVARKVMRLCR